MYRCLVDVFLRFISQEDVHPLSPPLQPENHTFLDVCAVREKLTSR